MYLPRFDPWEMYLAFIYIILSSLFRYKELKMALINLDLHSITLFWQLKFWAVFGRVFVSFWAGNRPSNLATLLQALLQVERASCHAITWLSGSKRQADTFGYSERWNGRTPNCGQASRALKCTVKRAALFFVCASSRGLTVRVLRAV